MIIDGAGYNTFIAVSHYQGKDIHRDFDVRYAVTTYSMKRVQGNTVGSYDPEAAWGNYDYVTSGATDSAATTAMSSGGKTYDGALGVGPHRERLTNICETARKGGKAAGSKSSVQWSQATPAAFGAHDESRDNYVAIAAAMVNDSGLNVIMGSGNPYHDNDGRLTTPTYTDPPSRTSPIWPS